MRKRAGVRSMKNWLLIVVLLYLGLSIGNGYRKGLVRMVFSVVALFVVVVISRVVAPSVEEYLRQETTVWEQIQGKTDDYVEGMLGERLNSGLFSVSDQAYAIETLPLPKYIRSALTKNNVEAVYRVLGVSAFEDYISGALAALVMAAIAFILSFLGVGLGVFVAAKLIERIFKLPGLNGVNRLGGAAVGGIKALIVLWVLCLVVTAAAGTKGGQQILGMIRESQVLSMIYNHNYLMDWVAGVFEIF